MLDLPPFAQTIVVAFLIVGYIATFFFQKHKIQVLRDAVASLKELTDGQKNHIETYKSMVSLDTIKEVYELQIKSAEEKAKKEIQESLQKYKLETIQIISKTSEITSSNIKDKVVTPLTEKLTELYAFLIVYFYDLEHELGTRGSKESKEYIMKTFLSQNEGFFNQMVKITLEKVPPDVAAKIKVY